VHFVGLFFVFDPYSIKLNNCFTPGT